LASVRRCSHSSRCPRRAWVEREHVLLAGGADGQEDIRSKRRRNQFGSRVILANDGDVHPTPDEGVFDVARVGDIEYIDARKTRSKLSEPLGHHVHARGRACPDSQAALAKPSKLLQRASRVLQRGQRDPGALDEQEGCLGGHTPPAQGLEERQGGLTLECRHLLRHGGLGESELAGSPREAPGLHHRNEGTEPLKLHES
jgi:hypothetical protein